MKKSQNVKNVRIKRAFMLFIFIFIFSFGLIYLFIYFWISGMYDLKTLLISQSAPIAVTPAFSFVWDRRKVKGKWRRE